MFPTTPKPTAEGMNYTVVVGGGWIILCLLYYYLPRYGGVYWFKGPMANVDTESYVEKTGSVSMEGEKEYDRYSTE